MFTVQTKNIEGLFKLLSKPTISSNGHPTRFRLGFAALPIPLKNISVGVMGTGTEIELWGIIETAPVPIVNQDGEQVGHTNLPIELPTKFDVPEGLNFTRINQYTAQVTDEDNVEIFFVYRYEAGFPIVISAGLSAVPSAPRIEIDTKENLENDFMVFGMVIETVINSMYKELLSVVVEQKKLIELMVTEEEPLTKELENYELMIKNSELAINTNTTLYLNAPLSKDEIFDGKNDDEEDDEGPGRDHIGNPPNEVKQENMEYGLSDVAGIEEQKKQITEILEFLKDPEKFGKLGARVPKSVLLSGPPGVGKTMLAQAIAKEAKVPFFMMNGSGFVEIYVGVGAGRVRKLFKIAKKKAPCIIFIDEIDAVAGTRGSGLNSERKQTLNQILVEIDGFEKNTGVIVIVATNRPDTLDSAFVSRFNRQIVLYNPDLDAREAILEVHKKGKTLEDGVNLRDIARITIGFSGRDLENLLNEAALLAARRDKDAISEDDINDARDIIIMGTEGTTKNMSKEELTNIAYHEAGHAILFEVQRPHTDPVYKVTITPHGHALGRTMPLPDEDRRSSTKTRFLARIRMLMGGMAAEIILSGNKEDVTTSAHGDIESATNTITEMITIYGMSTKFGPVDLDREDISEKTKEGIDGERKTELKDALEKAIETLRKHEADLRDIAADLLLYETITGDRVREIMAKNAPKLDDLGG